MIMEIFTWWNKQTIGTRVWSYFNGIAVGKDEYGNRYFSNKKDTKRWVIYGGQVEATTVNPEWNNWLRFTSIEKPEYLKLYEESKALNKKFKKETLQNIPLGRFAKESDIATAVVYLASNAASMMTGSSLVIDGGWTAK